jgi:hypothetical protein
MLVTDQDCPFEDTFHFIRPDRDLHIRAHRASPASPSLIRA